MLVRPPLEAHTRTKIDRRLENLGWVLDQGDLRCNVFQEQAKTEEQNRKFQGNNPDYVLYEMGTNNPVAIIEAKRPGESLEKAMEQAIKKYARPLPVPLVFAFNETFVASEHVFQSRPLKIDGEELQEFVDQATALRFVHEGAEILSAPKGINFSRDQLIAIFVDVNKLLRKHGLREGYERFMAIAEILFLKLIDEFERLSNHKGDRGRFQERYLWSNFVQKYSNDDQGLLDFVSGSVWPALQKRYTGIFNDSFSIRKPATLKAIIRKIDPINLTATDTDVKGDAFEYFLKTVTNGNKDLGEYFTPRHIVRTMVNLVKPIHGETIYDPFCGTGGFLLEAFKYLSLRTDTSDQSMMRWLKRDALHGRELTSTARITKMNMILFGDGHTNIEETDSLEHPVDGKYKIVLSNIPYSQETDFGSSYPIPTKNADSVCVQHIWRALKPGGRAAVIVPETFLYGGGAIGKTREIILRGSRKFTVISLPRGVFMPYTPTKTNVIYFEKDGQFKHAFFFVVQNDGFELNTRRKPIPGDSDIKAMLSEVDEPQTIRARANIVSREAIAASGIWNIRPFFYMDDVPEVNGTLAPLSEVLRPVKKKTDPREEPDREWRILSVTQNGVFLGDSIKGSEATQSYKAVRSGDIVYNPYRVNIGSIGVVPAHLDNSLVSPAYVVVRSKRNEYPPSYIISILKQRRYLRVIMNYSLSSARASLPFEELIRINIPKPTAADIHLLKEMEGEMEKLTKKAVEIGSRINSYTAGKLVPEGNKPAFEALLRRAVPDESSQPESETSDSE